MLRMIDADDLDDIAVGGAILGTGGGGDPYIGKLMAREAIRRNGPVRLIDVDEVDDDDWVVPACMMGAPTVMNEKLPQGDEIVIAFRKLEAYLGRPIAAILCAEAGGLNSTMPFVVGAQTGLPVVDGDGMGRAFPELQMVTFTLHGVSATPMVLADDKGNSIILDTIDNHWTERLARSATVDMGGAALLAFYPMTGATAKKAAIRRTLTLATDLGRTLRRSRAKHSDPVLAMQERLGALPLFRGRVRDVERRTVGGFARGETTIEGLGSDKGSTLSLDFQNEFLIARRDDVVLATTPDLITLLDVDTGDPITTESLRFGLRVAALGIPCTPQWRSSGGIELVGPRYFGYDLDYRPLEDRMSATAA